MNYSIILCILYIISINTEKIGYICYYIQGYIQGYIYNNKYDISSIFIELLDIFVSDLPDLYIDTNWNNNEYYDTYNI